MQLREVERRVLPASRGALVVTLNSDTSLVPTPLQVVMASESAGVTRLPLGEVLHAAGESAPQAGIARREGPGRGDLRERDEAATVTPLLVAGGRDAAQRIRVDRGTLGVARIFHASLGPASSLPPRH